MKRLSSLLLAFTLMLGLFSQAALAKQEPKTRFQDVSEDDWSWPYVLELYLKGLMKGTGDGRFEPNAPLTRAQAVTVAVRLIGLEDEALALRRPEASLEFTDRDAIPDWARPYVAMAVQQDIMPVAEDGLFRPNEKATRLWVSVLLVRALGYDAEARAKMSATLPFRDAKVIPSSLVGYVAAAVDHGLVQGFPDGTFQPNQPVTRAQAAALLSRTDDQLADLGRTWPDRLVGELVRAAANGKSLTMRVQDRERTISVHKDAAVFLDGAKANLNKLPAGARLTVLLDQNGTAILVLARKPETANPQQEVRGVITEVLRPEEMAGRIGLIVIKPGQGPERAFSLAPAVTVRYDGRTLSLKDLRAGDEVVLRVAAGVVVSIEVKHRAPAPPKEEVLRGTLTAVSAGSGSAQGTLSLRTGNQTRNLRVATNAVVTHGQQRLSLTDLRAGDEVTVWAVDGVVNRIAVEKLAPRGETVTGTIRAVYEVSISFQPSIEVETSKGVRTLRLTPEAIIRHGGSRLALGDLRVGDQVTVQVEGGVAVSVEVTRRAPSEEVVRGVITAVQPGSPHGTLSIRTGSQTRNLRVPKDAVITDGREVLSLTDLRVGDEVTARVVGGVVTQITLDKPVLRSETVTGKIRAVYEVSITFQPSIEVETSQGVRTLPLAPDATIRHNGSRLRLSDLRVGDQVTIQVVGGTAVAIDVTARGPAEKAEEVKGVIEEVYLYSISFQPSIKVKTASGSKTIPVAAEAEITRNGRRIRLEDLKVGEPVTLRVVSGIATAVTVTDPDLVTLKGTLVGIFERKITIRTDDGKLRDLTLARDAKLTYRAKAITIDRLYTGDKVALTMQGDLITHLDVIEGKSR